MTSEAIHEDLLSFHPQHDFFVGIDSDGCVFDSMEPKQKECFCPVTIEKWGLAGVSKYAREVWEFVNLYSIHRGCNRFIALLTTCDILRERPEVIRRSVEIPILEELRGWSQRTGKLSNPALQEEIERTGSEELIHVMDWSLAINRAVEQLIRGVTPFPHVRESLEKLQSQADMVVVSSTPVEALKREWNENGIDPCVALIAGQEQGKKGEILIQTSRGPYGDNHTLMIGDAKGDLDAARSAGCRFYPIVPGEEELSWLMFHEEVIDIFLAGKYDESREAQHLASFTQALPEQPPWIQNG
ncbi:HAD family hydrolase [Candidatus Neomarinimicrobiota bacterium]